MKTCSKCKAEKPFDDFFRDSSKKDGYQSRCKACVAEHNNSARRKASKAKYQKSSKGKLAMEKYLQSPKGKDTAARYRSSPEYKARIAEYNKSPERKESKAKYRKSPKGRSVDCRIRHTRRANLANVPSDNWKASQIHSEANGRCLYCGIKVGLDEMHADHYIPLSKGGSNLRENIVCSCASCNLKKNDKMPEDFIGETL